MIRPTTPVPMAALCMRYSARPHMQPGEVAEEWASRAPQPVGAGASDTTTGRVSG